MKESDFYFERIGLSEHLWAEYAASDDHAVAHRSTTFQVAFAQPQPLD